MANEVMGTAGIAVGRIVHYVLESGRCKGEHRPAIVVKVWNVHASDGMVQLQVFTDGTNDFAHDVAAMNVTWRTSVHYSDDKEPGTWHWPERPGTWHLPERV